MAFENFVSKTARERAVWAQFDALNMGAGWDEEDLTKPQILVEDVWGDSHPGSYHLNQLTEEARIGVYEKGGHPAMFHATDICDGCGQGHDGMNIVLASREALCDLVEVHGTVNSWDGLLLCSSCDKAIPAHLKAAARLDVPTVFIPGGSKRPGPDRSSSAKAGEVTLRMRRGEISAQEVRDYKLTGCPSVGAGGFMGTASTMQCMAEALGLALPGSAVAPATQKDILRGARRAGRAVMNLVEKGITAGQIMTEAAFRNAIIVHAAIGGSTNAMIHLPSIAKELGIELKPELFDEINRSIPHLCNVYPSGQYFSEDLWFAGGIPMIQWMLRDYLDLRVMTCTGKTLGENLEDVLADHFFERNIGYLHNYGLEREDVIIPAEKAETGSLAVLRGNIAPGGAVIKYAACKPELRIHKGPARAFNSEEEAYQAVVRHEIQPGDIIIVRYEGPRGSGMPELLMLTDAIVADPDLNATTALITDGRFSGATGGACIGHISPEAASGGPLAYVHSGDIISYDIPNRSIDLVGIDGVECGAEEAAEALERRAAAEPLVPRPPRKGLYLRYTSSALSAMEGAGY